MGAEIIAISVDGRSDAEAMVREEGLEFPVLYDTTEIASRAWGVYNLLGDAVAAPATFVFNAHGELIASHIGSSAGDRPSGHEVLQVISESLSHGTAAATPTAEPSAPTSSAIPAPATDSGGSSSSGSGGTEPTATPVDPTPPRVLSTPSKDSDESSFSLGPGITDFTLPNVQGGEVTLSEVVRNQPTVIVFYRAFW